ncbi:hypothetical protein AB1Y20_015220 [Prymnesium parvum]|uniref:cellulose 1,4-beta-cellobiosidase (non-reducing end) n=1 Tax=Prymnesium parvum TaxID=97485 RepID=A0AB34K0R8_PRYPA
MFKAGCRAGTRHSLAHTHSSRIVWCCALHLAWSLKAVPFSVDEGIAEEGALVSPGFVVEPYGSQAVSSQGGVLSVTGNNRVYLVEDEWTADHFDWKEVRYKMLRLAGKTLSFTVDLSNVGCGCDASVYLVGMQQPSLLGSNYCDIQGVDDSACTEIDLLEGNRKAVQSTLHVRTGHGADGTCNQDGCYMNWGKEAALRTGEFTSDFYGPTKAAKIDTRQPFEVESHFAEVLEGLRITISLSQDGLTVPFFDSLVNGNTQSQWGAPPTAVIIEDQNIALQNLRHGMVLVVSLWKADDLSWLDGGCTPLCELETSTVKLSDMRIHPVPPPPSPPPSPLPPLPPPPPAPPAPPPPSPAPHPPPPPRPPEGFSKLYSELEWPPSPALIATLATIAFLIMKGWPSMLKVLGPALVQEFFFPGSTTQLPQPAVMAGTPQPAPKPRGNPTRIAPQLDEDLEAESEPLAPKESHMSNEGEDEPLSDCSQLAGPPSVRAQEREVERLHGHPTKRFPLNVALWPRVHSRDGPQGSSEQPGAVVLVLLVVEVLQVAAAAAAEPVLLLVVVIEEAVLPAVL